MPKVSERVADNLREIKPHIFVTVPRLLERVYDKLVSAGDKLTGFKKKVFFWALDLALEYEMYQQKKVLCMKPNVKLQINLFIVNGVRPWVEK